MTCYFHKIHSVVPLPDYELQVRFKDGTTKKYDMKPLIESREVFAPLKDPELFYRAKVDNLGGLGIVWNDQIDLSSEDFWEDGQIIEKPFDDLMSLSDASEIWEMAESTLRRAIQRKIFLPHDDVMKFGKQWVIRKAAMERVYGPMD